MLTELNKVNWCDKQQVIDLAKRLGPDNCVVKYATRSNYNIVKPDRALAAAISNNVKLVFWSSTKNMSASS